MKILYATLASVLLLTACGETNEKKCSRLYDQAAKYEASFPTPAGRHMRRSSHRLTKEESVQFCLADLQDKN